MTDNDIIHPILPADSQWVKAWICEHWGDEIIVVHGMVYHPHQYPGYYARMDDGVVGLITYRMENNVCEILTLDSLLPGQGIGTGLLNAVRNTARGAGCKRIWLITTNDNLQAISFYQHRGFEQAAVHTGAVERARKIKPSIPIYGKNGIPIQDEIEFEEILL